MSKWINVAEALPKEYERVLICNDRLLCAVGWINDDGEWRLSWDGSKLREVTHWQPLPEPPKEVE